MKRRRVLTCALAVAAFPFLMASATSSRAAVVMLQASETAVLQNLEDSHERRLLVHFELPSFLSEGTVEIALLEFQTAVSSADSSGAVSLDCFAVTSSWTAETAYWSHGWTSIGGDYDESSHALSVVAPGSSSGVRFDVTDVVARWISGDAENHGFIVAGAPSEADALAGAEGAAAIGETPKLTIWYAPRRDEEATSTEGGTR